VKRAGVFTSLLRCPTKFLFEWGNQCTQAQSLPYGSLSQSANAKNSTGLFRRMRLAEEKRRSWGNEHIVLDNPIFEVFKHNPDAFFTLCGFEVERFR
jgi:hypothetical protein